MRRRAAITVAMLLCLAQRGDAQISIPYTFTAGSVISSTEVNANFAALGGDALDRTGGNMTGTLTGIDAVFSGLFSVDNLAADRGSISDLTVSTSAALPTDTTIGGVSSTELGYLDGVTSSIQTQLTALGGGSGRIVQIISASTTTPVVVSDTTYVTSGLSATITPTSADSVLIVLTSQVLESGNTAYCGARLLRDATTVADHYYLGYVRTGVPFVAYVEADAATATTFDVHIARNSGSNSCTAQIGNSTGWILIVEISQ